MKKIITSVLLLMTTLVTFATDDYLNVYTNGGPKTLSVTDVYKVTFSTSSTKSLLIHRKSSSVPISISFSDLNKLVFEDSPAGIENVLYQGDEIKMNYSAINQVISIKSTKDVTTIQIYNIQGELVILQSPQSQDIEIDITELPGGLYIVKAITASAIKTQKILKR